MKLNLVGKRDLVQWGKKTIRVLVRSGKGFGADQCSLRASALTLYTLFSIVPVMAMAFGIAKGFGFQQYLESEVMALFAGREEIIAKVLTFSNNLLERTKGGIMAVLGVILLIYSLIKLMSHIEANFNRIWCISTARPMIRKVTDYLTISLGAGVLVLGSGSFNIFMAARYKEILGAMALPAGVQGLLSLGVNLFPFVTTWILFVLCYMIMPNKKINTRAALAGGIIAGSLFQIIQIAYLKFMVGMSSYNAIYGSFAALPLFLIWLQASWQVLLLGGEIAYNWENTDLYETCEIAWDDTRIRDRKLMLLQAMKFCVKQFEHKEPPVTDVQISRQLSIPLHTARILLDTLVTARLLHTVVVQDDGQDPSGSPETGVAPAMDIHGLSIMDVISAIENSGTEWKNKGDGPEARALEQSLEAFDQAARDSAGEHRLNAL